MKMFAKSALLALLVSIALLGALVSCSGGDDTTAQGTDTKLPESTDAINYETVIAKKMAGIRPFSVRSSDPRIATANIPANRNSIAIVAYNPGTADLTVSDCFGFEAVLRVTVADDGKGTVTYELVSHQMDDFFEVQTDGGVSVNNNVDVTAKVQEIIDAAAPGDTIYFYPGRYRISTLVMREGVNLRLATTMTDATAGYTEEIAEDFKSGFDIAVMEKTLFLNNDRGNRGAEGADNFSIIGGALLSRAFIFSCADNVSIENLIVKDTPEAHAFQITGCTGFTLRNCLIAGYDCKGYFPKEVLQIEHSHPGATGDAANAPLTFKNGEFYVNESIAIEDCYFGPSDTLGAPLIAIGHHGYVGRAEITGFSVKNNVFDRCLHSAIRYTNLVNTEIVGNSFIASPEAPTIDASGANRPAFIVIYDAGASMSAYKSVVNGTTVTVPTYQSGTHDMLISDNVFTIEGGSDKRILDAQMATNRIGAKFVSGIYVAESFDSVPRGFSGYVDSLNALVDLSFVNNTVNINGQPTYNNQFFNSAASVGMIIENNTLNFADGVSFSSEYNGLSGFNVRRNLEGSEATARYIDMKSSQKYVSVCDADGAELFRVKASATATLTLNVEGGGRVDTHCENGIVQVILSADEGCSFDGWYIGGSAQSSDMTIASDTLLIARFTGK